MPWHCTSAIFWRFFDRILRPFLQPPIRQQITLAARQNMSPELRACKNLADAEALLRAEEQQCLNFIKDSFNVPDQIWNECLADIQEQVGYCREVYFKTDYPIVDHSLSTIDPKLYNHVTTVLTKYGINPKSINIVYDQKYHDEHPNCEAYSRSPSLWRTRSKIEELRVLEPAQLSITPSNLINASPNSCKAFTPYHEGIHQIEGHYLQNQLVLRFLMSLSKKPHIFSHISLKRWYRTQEKIAEIMPLIKFKEPQHVQSIHENCMNTCVNDVRDSKKITWNTTAKGKHPDACAEMLPWILKIQELMPKEPQ
jgi:hypothetical protein